MANSKRKYIYIPIIVLFIAGLFYDGYLLYKCKEEFSKVTYTLIFQDRETYNYFIEHIKENTSDTINIDTTKIKYINTDNNEENKGTKERKRN